MKLRKITFILLISIIVVFTYGCSNNTDTASIDNRWYENKFYRSDTNNKDIFFVRPSSSTLDVSAGNSIIASFNYPMEYELLKEKEGNILRYTYTVNDYKATILYYTYLDKVGISVINEATGMLKMDTYHFDEELTSKGIRMNYNRADENNSSTEKLDLPDEDQIRNELNNENISNDIANLLVGYFISEDGDELEIIDNGYNIYYFNFSIYRVASVELVGTYDEGYINFEGSDSNDKKVGYVTTNS